MRRREFLIGLPALVAGRAAAPLAAAAADSFYVLGPEDTSRLKLDFNTNKSKVRLLFMLSPT